MGAVSRGKRLREEEVDADGTWAVSYGDMVTLLLTFFILFFSIDPTKSKSSDADSDIEISFGDAARIKNKSGVVDRQGAAQIPQTMDEIVKELKGEIVYKGKKVIIDFPEVSFFKSGKIPLTQKGQSVLEEFSKVYSNYMGKYILVIQAYTDIKKVKQNGRVRFSDNLELSALRGVSTMRILQKSGIPLRRMRVAGYGEIEMTIESLSKGEIGIVAKKRLLDLARRVVLIIEPEVKP